MGMLCNQNFLYRSQLNFFKDFPILPIKEESPYTKEKENSFFIEGR